MFSCMCMSFKKKNEPSATRDLFYEYTIYWMQLSIYNKIDSNIGLLF